MQKGYFMAHGYKCLNNETKNIRVDNKGKIGTSMLYYLFSKLGYNVSINTNSESKPEIYRINCSLNTLEKKKTK